MRRRTTTICLVLLGGLVLCPYMPLARSGNKDGNAIKNPKRFQESLRGKWLLQCRTVNGKRLEEPDGVYLLVTKDGVMKSYSPVGAIDGPGPSLVENVFYRIDAGKDPATIDTTGRTDWTELCEGICRLEKDSLTLCFASKNKPRPTMFSTGAGDGMGAVLMIYKRVVNDRK